MKTPIPRPGELDCSTKWMKIHQTRRSGPTGKCQAEEAQRARLAIPGRPSAGTGGGLGYVDPLARSNGRFFGSISDLAAEATLLPGAGVSAIIAIRPMTPHNWSTSSHRG